MAGRGPGRLAAEPPNGGRLGEPARRAAPVATAVLLRRARGAAPVAGRRRLLAFGLAALAWPRAVQAEAGPLRIASLQYGTVNWELETIRAQGLDAANGVALEVLAVSGDAAARIAFQGGAADAIVADFLWVARERAAGKDFVFVPYSLSVGGLLVPPGSPIHSLADLKGAKIGIAGGPLDKSWLMLRAMGLQQGHDLAALSTQVYAAPPLLSQQAEAGGLDAIITYWHYGARLQAKGFRVVASTAEAARTLALDPGTPLLGYVFDGRFVAQHPDRVAGFARASRAAKAALQSDTAWEPLREIMKAANEAEFAALRAGFRAGIPAPGPVDVAAAARLYATMAALGGAELVGDAPSLPAGVFLDPAE